MQRAKKSIPFAPFVPRVSVVLPKDAQTFLGIMRRLVLYCQYLYMQLKRTRKVKTMNTWAVLSRKRLLAAILVAMACAICILAGPALAQPATQDTNDKADSAAIVDGQESAGESDAEAGADGEGNDAEGVDGANAEGNVAEAAGDDANGNADGEGQEEEGASVVNPKTQAEEYAITVKNSEYGTVEDVPEKASAGDTVTVSVKPNTGYALSSLKYTAGSESDTITAATNGKYSFKMPAANVQIQAEFAKTYEVTIGEASNGTIKLDGPDGEDVTKLKAMKGDIVTVHLSDIDSDGKMRLPLKGTTDFKELFLRLNDVGFNGALLIEVYTSDYDSLQELLDCRENLNNLASKIF